MNGVLTQDKNSAYRQTLMKLVYHVHNDGKYTGCYWQSGDLNLHVNSTTILTIVQVSEI